jgi:hypothetical protein
MFKKLVLLTVVILSALSLPARAFWNNDITMLVMPREVIPLQIAQDISRRYPVLIVSYQLTKGELKLFAWNGDSWVAVPVDDYTSGTFFANRPKHAIVVENERFHAPDVLVPSGTWCESANRLSSTDPRVMLHLLGLQFNFPFRHWDQLAKRYGYSIEEINPTLNNVHWWNLRGDVLLEKRAQRNYSIDLDNWYVLETLPPPPVETVLVEEQPVNAPEVTAPVPEPVKVIKVNAPVAKPVPAQTKEKTDAVLTAADVATKTPVVAPAPAPVMEPAPIVEAVPAITTPVSEAEKAIEPVAVVEADPFSAKEIPAAEIVVPQEPKKPWWKLF